MRRFYVPLAFLALAIALLGPSESSAHSGDVIDSSYVTPTIDGVIGAGEWSASETIPVFSGAFAGSYLYVLNDGTNMYFYVSVVGDDNLSGVDRVIFRLDNAHNGGGADTGDDNISASGTDIKADMHFDRSSWGIPDAIVNGAALASRNGSVNIFELSHPLNSTDDANDISVTADSIFGICLIYSDDGTSTSNSTFPTNCNVSVPAQDTYADVVLDPTPVGDANCGGSVDSIDALLVLQAVAGLPLKIPCADEADANQDTYLLSTDALLILQYVAGLLSALPPP